MEHIVIDTLPITNSVPVCFRSHTIVASTERKYIPQIGMEENSPLLYRCIDCDRVFLETRVGFGDDDEFRYYELDRDGTLFPAILIEDTSSLQESLRDDISIE